jgi:hypothetical protein
MKVKTSTLKDRALDWAVAKCEGHTVSISKTGYLIFCDPLIQCGPAGTQYSPSTKWSQGGPILSRQRINRDFNHNSGLWQVFHSHGVMHTQQDRSELVAGMRCYVASHYGEEVEVSDELVQEMAV